MTEVGYLVAFTDKTGEFFHHGLPEEGTPRKVYRYLQDACNAAASFAETFEQFLPVAYGQAYPYEGYTLESYLQKHGAAPYGWVILQDEDGETIRLCISLVRLYLG